MIIIIATALTIISSIIPANKASKVDPQQAIRYG